MIVEGEDTFVMCTTYLHVPFIIYTKVLSHEPRVSIMDAVRHTLIFFFVFFSNVASLMCK